MPFFFNLISCFVTVCKQNHLENERLELGEEKKKASHHYVQNVPLESILDSQDVRTPTRRTENEQELEAKCFISSAETVDTSSHLSLPVHTSSAS